MQNAQPLMDRYLYNFGMIHRFLCCLASDLTVSGLLMIQSIHLFHDSECYELGLFCIVVHFFYSYYSGTHYGRGQNSDLLLPDQNQPLKKTLIV